MFTGVKQGLEMDLDLVFLKDGLIRESQMFLGDPSISFASLSCKFLLSQTLSN